MPVRHFKARRRDIVHLDISGGISAGGQYKPHYKPIQVLTQPMLIIKMIMFDF